MKVLLPKGVEGNEWILLGKALIFITVDSGKHCAVGHMMTVNDQVVAQKRGKTVVLESRYNSPASEYFLSKLW